MQWRRWLGLCVAMFGLVACVSNPGGGTQRIAEKPVSEQTETTENRQRAKVHTELGALYMQSGRFAVALDETRIALESDSSYPPAYNLLGLVRMFLGETSAAEEAFRSALNLAPNDPEINNNYGWFLCQTGKPEESLRYFRSAYNNTLYKTPTKPYTNAGLCLLRQKQYKEAEEHLNTALRYDAGNTQAMYWLGELYYQTGRLVEARTRVNEMSRMLEPSVEITWLGVRVERKLGDREAELRHATQLRRRFQETPEYQKLMQGQYE